MARRYLLAMFALALSGCVASTNEKIGVSYWERDLVCGIDENVLDEQAKWFPTDLRDKPDSSGYWQGYWNHRVYYLGNAKFERELANGYTGLSGRALILYALRQRQEVGLPDVIPEERNATFVPELYTELENTPRSSCAILGGRSPVCRLAPARHPGSPIFQRPCGSKP